MTSTLKEPMLRLERQNLLAQELYDLELDLNGIVLENCSRAMGLSKQRDYVEVSRSVLNRISRIKHMLPELSKGRLASSFVYLAYNPEDGLHKIGWSSNPEIRDPQLRTEWGPEIAIIHFRRARKMMEATLHRRYSRLLRRGREWFALSERDVEECMSILDTGIIPDPQCPHCGKSPSDPQSTDNDDEMP